MLNLTVTSKPQNYLRQEYYEEESIVELYQTVLERLIIATADEEDDLSSLSSTSLAVHEERLRVWPPWPWPPWDPEDPDEPGDGGEHKPINRTKEASKLAEEIIEFEKKIANASLDLYVFICDAACSIHGCPRSSDILFQDPIATYNPVPVSNLTEAIPEINFNTYFASFTPRNYPNRVILTSSTYPASLSAILKETSQDTLEVYLETRAALSLAPYLGTSTESWRATRALEERLGGIKPGAMGDRAEYCVGRIEVTMGFAAGRYFVEEVFSGESREKGTKVITGKLGLKKRSYFCANVQTIDIVDAFKKSLKEISWMDKESAKAAAEKVI